MTVNSAHGIEFDITTDVAVVGAGACGQVAALTIKDAGIEPLLLERDAAPQGSTALSSGMIPACQTALQRAAGVDDPVEQLIGDLTRKAKGEADPAVVARVAAASGPTIDWLAEDKQIPLHLVQGFRYPGHSALRMHAPPSKTGAELIGSLTARTEAEGIDLLTGATVTTIFAGDDGRVAGIGIARPDGSEERIGCRALVLACNGFGGNPEMLQTYIPEIVDAVYCGHVGNQGDAVRWGEAMGGAIADMGAFQGHGSVAQGHNILITWALMMEGGIQVNQRGERFSNEHAGYSEQAKIVAAQPDAVAWDIYDGRLHELGMSFEDYREAEAAGAVVTAKTPAALAEACSLPADALTSTLEAAARCARGERDDPFGRDFTGAPALTSPYFAIRVCGALFHTQGGLVIDPDARVLRPDGTPLPNLFAGGGAARGLSGKSDYGYLSGNGLLAAVVLGRIAGQSAARFVAQG